MKSAGDESTSALGGEAVRVSLDFASNWQIRGGVWRQGVSLASALVRMLPPGSVTIPCYGHLPGEYREELHATGAEVLDRGLQTHLDSLEGLGRYRGRYVHWDRLMTRLWGPRILDRVTRKSLRNSNVYHYLLWPRGRIEDRPMVGTIQDLIPVLMPEESPIARGRFQKHLDAVARGREPIIVPSVATKQDLVERAGLHPSRVHTVPYGIDHRVFRPEDDGGDDAVLGRHRLERGRYLLYVGTIERRKNLDTLIGAYRIARHSHGLAMPLVLSGAVAEGMRPLVDEIEADESGHLRYLGYAGDGDLPALYRGARASVLVSRYEGFGFPPLESMACGTPTIISDSTSLAEVAGPGGLRVDPGRPEEIASAVSAVASDELHGRLREMGLARASRFTWEAAARATLEIYREAIASFSGLEVPSGSRPGGPRSIVEGPTR